MWSLLKRNDLTKRIAQLTEELEELRSEKTQILARFDYAEDKDIQQVRTWVRMKEKNIDDLRAKESQCEENCDAALAEFQNLSHKAAEYDPDKLWPERLKLWVTMSQETEDQLRSHFGKSFSHRCLQIAEADVSRLVEQDNISLRGFVECKRHNERDITRKARNMECGR